jgi:outer membrane protein assembly factor BamA
MMRSSGLVVASLLGLGLLRAQSSTQRNPFENVPKPPEPPAPTGSGFTIESIEFRSAKRIPNDILRAMIHSRVGGAYDIATLRRDADALQNTRRFSGVILETEPGRAGAIVRFFLAERPLIQALDYQGDDTVTMAQILERFTQRKITLLAETLFDEAELGRAAMTIQELVAERGRRNTTVTPFVEPTGPPLLWPSPTVKITFKVAEKQ